MTKWTGWVLACGGVIACGGGGGSDGGSSDQLCTDLTAKVEQCQLGIDTSGGCVSNPGAAALCAARCVVDADCGELTGPPGDNAYYRCLGACSGAAPDDFICADGSGFLPRHGVCDGVPQCPDASDEADCGAGDAGSGGAAATSGGGASTTTVGGASTRGSGGSGGAGPGGRVTPAGTDFESLCAADADYQIEACGQSAANRQAVIDACLADSRLYEGESCGDAWRAYLECAAAVAYDCTDGPPCATEQDAYFACQSAYVGRTGCTRLGAQDAQCSGPTPYAVGCVGAAPSECTAFEATMYCCPAL